MVAVLGCGEPHPPTTQPATQPSRAGVSAFPAKPSAARAAEEYVDVGPGSGRTHLVEAHDTLYSLAQQYYGDKKLWRRIYAANRNRLDDPNHLPVGMRLIIP